MMKRRYPTLIITNEKRRYAQVEYDGQWFDLDKKAPVPYETELQGYDSIYTAYGKPSNVKVNIWRMWKKWFDRNDGVCVVSSRNSWMFSIEGFFTDKATGKRYFARITQASHRLYEVES